MTRVGRPHRRFRRFGLLAASIAASLLVCELALRVWSPIALRTRGDSILLPTNVQYQFENIASDKLERHIRVQRNSLGFRGPEPPADFEAALTMVAVGGSTTECWAQTDGKTWCDLVNRDLTSHLQGFWLNNAGLDGHSTYGHLHLLDQILEKLRPDYVLLLVGLNDMNRSDINIHDAASKLENASWTKRVIRASVLLSTVQTVWRSMVAKNLGLQHKWELDPRTEKQGADSPEEEALFLRRQIEVCIPGYEERLQVFVARTKAAGIRLILVTQPALYGDFVDPVTGVSIGDVRFANHCARTLGKGLDLFNAATRRIAQAAEVPCIDLAAELPKRSDLYYDWIHYSDLGAQQVAAILAPKLRTLLAEAHPDRRR